MAVSVWVRAVRSASRLGRGFSDAAEGGRSSVGIWLLRTDSTREKGSEKEDDVGEGDVIEGDKFGLRMVDC